MSDIEVLTAVEDGTYMFYVGFRHRRHVHSMRVVISREVAMTSKKIDRALNFALDRVTRDRVKTRRRGDSGCMPSISLRMRTPRDPEFHRDARAI